MSAHTLPGFHTVTCIHLPFRIGISVVFKITELGVIIYSLVKHLIRS